MYAIYHVLKGSDLIQLILYTEVLPFIIRRRPFPVHLASFCFSTWFAY